MSVKYAIRGCMIIVGLVYVAMSNAMQDPIVMSSSAGTVAFPHVAHGGTTCQQCHHVVDGQASRMACSNCHNKKSELKLQSKPVFHKLCVGCHVEQKKARIKTGPAKLCGDCHKPN